jgi:exosome complex RNA-binding protein Rrp4
MRKYIKPKNKPKLVIFKPREITNDKSLSEFISNGIDIVKYKICENNKDIKLILSMESSKLMALIGGLVLKNNGFISYKDVIKKIKSLSNELIEYPDNLMSACKIIELEHKGTA